jgi:hypothetical protein
MSLVTKMRNLTGSVPTELLEHGLLGRGIIASVEQTAVSTGPDFDPAHVCVFTVEVALHNTPRYSASCQQAVNATALPQLMLSGATVAVRVDPDDHSRIALSLCEEPQTVTIVGQGDPGTGFAMGIRNSTSQLIDTFAQRRPEGPDHKIVIDWDTALPQVEQATA